MVKAVVMEFDGVIRHRRNDKIHAIERRCKVVQGTLLAYFKDDSRAQNALLGRQSYDDWLSSIHEAIDVRYGRLIADYSVEAFDAAGFNIDHDLLDRCHTLFPNAKLTLATNSTPRLPLELKAAGLNTSFDYVFNSSAMGVTKPNRGFYHGLLITMGVPPKDVVFIDHSAENVTAASQVGMEALLFRSRSVLLKDLTYIALQQSILA